MFTLHRTCLILDLRVSKGDDHSQGGWKVGSAVLLKWLKGKHRRASRMTKGNKNAQA